MKIFACSVAVIATGSNAAAVIAFRISAVVFDDVVFVLAIEEHICPPFSKDRLHLA